MSARWYKAALFVHLSIAATAQYLSLEGGGAAIYPSVCYEHFFSPYPDDKYGNGLRLKLGLAYWSFSENPRQAYTVRGGVHAVWGKRNNWSAGIDMAQHFIHSGEDRENEHSVYLNVCFRFGKGWMQGFVGLGPNLLFHSGGDYLFPNPFILPFANAGLAFRLWDNKSSSSSN